MSILCLITGVLLFISKVNCQRLLLIGGMASDTYEYPYAAFLSLSCNNGDQGWSCGSSIINNYNVLTAAHCVESFNILTCEAYVYVGHENKLKGAKHKVTSMIVHHKYDPMRVINDIAILKVSPAIKYKDGVACLKINRHVPTSEYAELAAWGLVREEPVLSTKQLRRGHLKTWSRAQCMRLLRRHVPVGAVCAGGPGAVEYAAKGDSGSALVIRYNSEFYGIGLVSFKFHNVMTNLGIFTDLKYFYSWLSEHAQLNCK